MKKCKKVVFYKYFREICSGKRNNISYKYKQNYGKQVSIRI